MKFDEIKKTALIDKYIKKEDVSLILGCGNACIVIIWCIVFSDELYDYGYHNLINVDLSEVVINQMKERNKKRNLMKCIVVDNFRLSDGRYRFDFWLRLFWCGYW